MLKMTTGGRTSPEANQRAEVHFSLGGKCSHGLHLFVVGLDIMDFIASQHAAMK